MLFAFVAGRYHHARREERILLFVDMRASTAIAERLGEERFLDVRAWGNVVTWPGGCGR